MAVRTYCALLQLMQDVRWVSKLPSHLIVISCLYSSMYVPGAQDSGFCQENVLVCLKGFSSCLSWRPLCMITSWNMCQVQLSSSASLQHHSDYAALCQQYRQWQRPIIWSSLCQQPDPWCLQRQMLSPLSPPHLLQKAEEGHARMPSKLCPLSAHVRSHFCMVQAGMGFLHTCNTFTAFSSL